MPSRKSFKIKGDEILSPVGIALTRERFTSGAPMQGMGQLLKAVFPVARSRDTGGALKGEVELRFQANDSSL